MDATGISIAIVSAFLVGLLLGYLLALSKETRRQLDRYEGVRYADSTVMPPPSDPPPRPPPHMKPPKPPPPVDR